MTIGLFIVRAAVGVALVLQGSSKLTRQGRTDTASYFDESGFRPGLVMAVVAGSTEFGAGVLLAVGLATPLAAAGAVGVLVSAAAVNWSNGYWNANGGAEYPIVLGFTAAGLAFTGAGSFSLDEVVGWGSPSATTGAIAIVLALASSGPVLARRRMVMGRSLDRAPMAAAAKAA